MTRMPRAFSERRFFFAFATAAILVVSGCFLSVPEPPTQQSCEDDSDCPSDDPTRRYRCVGYGDAPKLCEVAFPFVGGDDGGTPALTETYCTTVKPMMAKYCNSCHTRTTQAAARPDFGLDHYEPQTLSDGGTEAGVKAFAARVKARTVDDFGTARAMPPPGISLPQPSLAEREALTRWEAAGAPYAPGSPDFDAAADCSEAAAGGGDGGVSFATSVQPIFQAKCVSCHSYLAAAAAHGEIVNKKRGCEPTLDLIEPGNVNDSFLWRKLVDDAGTRCGGKMPTSGVEILPAEQNLIKAWILEGAKNN